MWRRPDWTRAGVIGSETLALATSKAGVYLARHLARDGEKQLALEVLGDLVTEGFFCSTALQTRPVAEAAREYSGLRRSPGRGASARR